MKAFVFASSLALSALFAASSVHAAATGAPGTPTLTQDNWDGKASYSIIMNMWWGNNGTSLQLFENGALVKTVALTDNSPNAQTATVAFANKPNGSYVYTAKLTNSFGTTSGSALTYTVTQGGTGPTVPPVPTGLAATANSTSQITVTWSASSGATGYDLQVDGTIVSNVTSPYAHTGLAAGSSHTYAVRAKNSAGASAFSASVTAFTQSTPTIPAVPTGLTATVNSSSQITVTWNAVVNATGYDLQVDGATVSSVTSPYVHSGLAASSTHTYAVRAKNSVGSSAFSTTVSAKTQAAPTVPAVPTGLAAVANGSSQITVTWNASSGATGYDLQVDGTTVSDATSPYAHTGLAASSTHTYAVRAKNVAGASAFSTSVSATTSAVVSTGLPKRIMSGYWHSWGGGPGFIKLRDVNPNWDVINVAFAEPVTPGSTDGHMQLALTGLDATYTSADFKADIKTAQSHGKKIVLSIGGYNGYFSLTSSSAVSTFVSGIESFISQYGFDGIDIDLEQSSVQFNSGADPDFKNPVSPKVVNMIAAIRQICANHGSNFILSWAPETFYVQLGFQFYAGINPYVDPRAGDYLPMIYALRNQTTYVQVQLYNSGAILAPDGKSYSMGDTASIVAMCKMLLAGFNINQNASYFFPPLRPDQVVIGVPASSSAAGSGQVTNAQLQQAFGTLDSSYPGLRGIMAWSINWDNFQNANGFVQSNRAYLNTLH